MVANVRRATASRSGRNADRRRIAVVPVAERLHRRLDDVLGRAEIGLADAEIDDVAALRGKRIGAGEHGEGVLFADAVEGGDGLEGHAGKRAFYVGMDEIVALIEEGRIEMLGDRV